MEFPQTFEIKVDKLFEKDVNITLYSGLTVFVGENGAGKTQIMNALKNELKSQEGEESVRYLSSNRIGTMEEYRSRTHKYEHYMENFTLGDRETKEKRHLIETANGDFLTMDARRDIYIKVSERLSILFKRKIYLRWDSGNLKVFIEKIGKKGEYSVAGEASGLVNMISILAALYDEEIKVLFIDEPEVSLHPQLQSYLLREIKNVIKSQNKTVIIATHSMDMISINNIDDFSNIVFFKEGQIPIQISPESQELNSEKLKEFILTMGIVYKKAFFSKKVLLVEGVSDELICRFLCNKLEISIDIAGAEIIPVNGKGEIPNITKFFRLIGKEVIVLTDLDGFTDDNQILDLYVNTDVLKGKAIEYGLGKYSDVISNIKNDIGKLCDIAKDEIKEEYEKHPYWNSEDITDENKKIRRAIIGTLLSTCDLTIIDWGKNPEMYLQIKERLKNLFEDLKLAGCFVLPKGSLESYYCFENVETYTDKPSVAKKEISKLMNEDNNFITEQYKDIIEALEFVAISKNIDENIAIRKELLSELALVQEIVKEGHNQDEIDAEIKSKRGIDKSIFSYEIIEENGKKGVNVQINSNIIEVKGFPFKCFVGDNVNVIVNEKIC